ncbi:MAG TPA: alkyl sulfatase dimerization domain-containing protein [Deltaproteobacteria bacterium]|nr:alkyl sulfatase dimerization domain-containing protein [Deltaproteobacteria bacterium]HPR51617.1 alkyl sulfatase dimerization domain-containing protein [Deltaproteobacteria bacterium]
MKRLCTIGLMLLIMMLAACAHRPAVEKKAIEGVGAATALREHTKIFERGIEKVGDNVYIAIGFGLANSIMIEGDDGLIIVDTMESCEAATEVFAEFRKISQKPVKAIIYTHNHADHIFGAEVFAQGKDIEIYAHETTAYYVERLVSKMRTVIDMRSMRMFGNYLDEKGLVNSGIGPFLAFNSNSTLGYLPPTKTFSDTLDVEIAGIKLQLVHAPGETNDQLFVWLPNQRVMLCGDNFYWTFPNLYTIRGTPYRSLQQWYQSLDKIRDKNSEYLVPSHTRPIIGAEEIETILRDYRDAIQFVHDQAIRGINMGMTPDELAEYVKLPPHLADAPYLQPFYGKVSWSVRSVFSGNLGWFDGDSATLQPLTRKEKAQLMVRLAGSETALLEHAQDALASGEYQTALELTGYLAQLDPDSRPARDIRVKALIALGEREENPNARHYYLTEALEIRDNFIAQADAKPRPKQVHSFPLAGYFDLLAVNLDPYASADVDERVGIKFPDAGEAYIIHVRRGVAEIRPCEYADLDVQEFDIKVVADSKTFKEMLAKIKNPVVTLAGFEYEKGNTIAFAKFLRMFAPPQPKLPYEPFSD